MLDQNTFVEKTLRRLLREKKYFSVRDMLATMNPADIASILGEIEEVHLPLIFRLLPKELAAEVFVEMEPEEQELLIRSFSDSELRAMLDEMFVDDAVDMVEEMPANVVKRILAQADADMRKQINDILRYPEDSAGTIMTTEYVSLRPKMTVGEAILRIRRTGVDKETIYTCYVTEDRYLRGMVSVKSLLLCGDDDTPIADLMEENVISVRTTDDQEQVAKMFSKYNFLALPVTDTEGRMVGIVTVDDAMDVMEDEATEDMVSMAAVLPSDKSYVRSGVFDLVKRCFPWLLTLMLSSTFTGWIISSHQSTLMACTILTAFIPMLMGTGGNSGSQTSVAVIRSMSLGDLEPSELLRVLWKEIRIAVLCGAILAVCNFAKMILIDRMLLNNPLVTVPVALAVCLTLVLIVIVSKVVGCVLPMAVKGVGLDPAVVASPFITTVVDILSLLLYFGVANLLLT